ncbi:hypothetical protein EV191_11234 [Tamaricihabitans halophyticus]|uniref:Methyltransferase family protein n=1 Tax=Tamaricihabitans halophyticus TaxID=1262583 RepID=A0A4R2QDU3_9PSEU|nr:class I SAM-dependent methyltransferase [Tamaricihabitans halophyticus]TCP47240.1 hypothetical protein EV191_11234 [Tamaricihabitans halophyticus]
MEDADAALYAAIRAHVDGSPEPAIDAARQAATLAPEREFPRQLVRYLDTTADRADVYAAPEAFRSYIRGGGNIQLYQATSAALRAAQQRWPGRLLDIGVGDGLALLPALTDRVTGVDLVEPSTELLGKTVTALTERGIEHRAFYSGIGEFIRQHGNERWALTEATFALQSLPPAEWLETLSWIRAHSDALVLTEFDCETEEQPFESAWFADFLRRVERGLLEYDADRELVAQGFILPVLLGKFTASGARTNWEQPIEAWCEQLRSAGFAEVRATKLDDYWWRPAYLVEAS